jgi:hypothetical protein
MERALQACEPKLAAMFAIFARLTKDDTAPRTEALDGRWFLRDRIRRQLAAGHRGTAARIVLIPVLLASVVVVIVLGGLTTPAGRTCSLVRQAAAAAPAARAWICPAATTHH